MSDRSLDILQPTELKGPSVLIVVQGVHPNHPIHHTLHVRSRGQISLVAPFQHFPKLCHRHDLCARRARRKHANRR